MRPFDIRGSENLRCVRQTLAQRHLKISHLVILRIGAGKNGGMRWRSQWNLGIGSGENYGLKSECIEIRRQPALRSQKAHAISTHRIEGNQNDIRRIPRGRDCVSCQPRYAEPPTNNTHSKSLSLSRPPASCARRLSVPLAMLTMRRPRVFVRQVSAFP